MIYAAVSYESAELEGKDIFSSSLLCALLDIDIVYYGRCIGSLILISDNCKLQQHVSVGCNWGFFGVVSCSSM